MSKLNMKNPTSQRAEMMRVFRGLLRFEESLLLSRAINALNLVCFFVVVLFFNIGTESEELVSM